MAAELDLAEMTARSFGNSLWDADVVIVRHGRTSLNASGKLRGLLDVELDGTGRHQAELLGSSLGPLSPRAVLSSPLLRAVQTAEPIAKAAGTVVTIDDRLVDRDYGKWAGMPEHDVVQQWGSLDALPGVEPAAQVRQRALDVLVAALKLAVGSTVVLVSHDAINHVLLAILGQPQDTPQSTGCYNIVRFQKGGVRPLSWSFTAVNQVPPGTSTGSEGSSGSQ